MLATIPQGLTQQEAQIRAQKILNVEYHLKFHFRERQTFFNGETTLVFTTNQEKTEGLFLDATDLEIEKVFIGEEEVPEACKIENRRISLPAKYFSEAGKQYQVRVLYRGFFHRNQVGLFCFFDQETNSEYFFSHLEPYGANKVFPCFDQPDIPGKFMVELIFPLGWQAVTNTYFQEEPGEASDREQHWSSQKSLPFSTYLFALALGPFKVVEDERFPHIRLYLRGNRADNPNNFFEPNFLFEIAAYNLTYFEKQFASPHPYGKLDLVGVPSYINGGMENVGAIFLCETHMVNSEAPSRFQKYNQFLLISHEISHLWFGDLVTMAWWDDLWLKESFATLMSYEAATEISDFKDEVWVYFHEKGKRNLFNLDSHSRIRPVTRKVPDAETADWSFDGICYRKGASLLRQLQLYLGKETFWEGIRKFFKNNAYKAVRFQDLLDCFEDSGEQLVEYMNEWLKRSGYPKIKVERNNDVVTLTQQDSLGLDRIWTVPLEMQQFDFEGNTSRSQIRLTEKQQNFPLQNNGTISYVYPNGEDFSFVRPLLAKEDFANALKEKAPSEPIQRTLLQSALWDSVLHQELQFVDFFSHLQTLLAEETIALIYNSGIEKLIYGTSRFLLEEQQNEIKPLLKTWATQQLKEQKIPHDSAPALIDLIIFCIEKEEEAQRLFEMERSHRIVLSRKQKYGISIIEIAKGWKQVENIVAQPWFQKDPEFAQEFSYYLLALSSDNKIEKMKEFIERKISIEHMPGYLEALMFSASSQEKAELMKLLLPALSDLADSMRFWSFTPIVTKGISKQTEDNVLQLLQQFIQENTLSEPLHDLIQGALEDLEEDFTIRNCQQVT